VVDRSNICTSGRRFRLETDGDTVERGVTLIDKKFYEQYR